MEVVEKSKHTFYVRERTPEKGVVDEMIWKNVVRSRQTADDNITRPMHFAC
jgi:hypothetical protein